MTHHKAKILLLSDNRWLRNNRFVWDVWTGSLLSTSLDLHVTQCCGKHPSCLVRQIHKVVFLVRKHNQRGSPDSQEHPPCVTLQSKHCLSGILGTHSLWATREGGQEKTESWKWAAGQTHTQPWSTSSPVLPSPASQEFLDFLMAPVQVLLFTWSAYSFRVH